MLLKNTSHVKHLKKHPIKHMEKDLSSGKDHDKSRKFANTGLSTAEQRKETVLVVRASERNKESTYIA